MSTVQQAVAVREEERAKTPTLGDFVRQSITRQARDLSAVLPEHLDTERYSALVLTAVKANEKLMQAFRTEQGQLSVLLSVMQSAALGLEPNTPTQECWLQPRRNGGVDECELSIGYKGYAKLARRSGNLRELVAGVVREGDEFSWSRGLERDEFHHRQLSDDGDLTHAYCIARMTNGAVAFTVMTKAQVEKRRAMSESWKNDRARPYSPWTKWTEEQWRKTAIRNLLLHGEVDLSPELVRAATSDETPLAVGSGGMIEALITNEARAELESPADPPGSATDNGDRQEPASPRPEGEEEPATAAFATSSDSEGSSLAADGTVDPSTWTGEEWRAQLSAHKRKPADAIREAQRVAGDMGLDKPPATLEDLSGNADLAVALYTWMTAK